MPVSASATRPMRSSDHTQHAATRERLLDASERLFAERGFACASVREITGAAHCNLAAVNYHFGGKRGLYRALFRSRLAQLRERRVASVRQALAAGDETTLEGVLRVFADAFLEPLIAEGGGRRLLELIARETLDPQLPRALFEREVVEPVRGALADALVRLMPGLGRLAARRCVVSIVGQLMQITRRNRLPDHNGRGRRATLGELVDHIVCFSAAGVRACAKGR